MIRPWDNPREAGPKADLFDLEQVGSLLRDGISWPWRVAPCDVVLERCWPSRSGGFVFEWSFGVAGMGRRTLFGITGQDSSENETMNLHEARDTPDGIRDVCLYVPSWDLLLHSPDRDPVLPQLNHCLDGGRMEARLSNVLSRMNGRDPGPTDRVACRLLGYRPGRRASIAYGDKTSDEATPWLVGKTYVDDRGSRSARLHGQLNEQIAWYSDRRVKVPTVVDYLPDLHLTLCGHSRGRSMDNGSWWTPEDANRVAEALSALHQCQIEGLRHFSIEDECGVVRRWHAVLERLFPSLAESTRPVLDALVRLSTCVDDTRPCTAHRDFYEAQLLLGRRMTTILDLDTLALSHPCLDLGNLLAHLYLDRLVRGRSLIEFDDLAGGLVKAYESRMSHVDHRALTFYCASSLFRIGAVHAIRTRTGRHSPAMWEFAEEVILNEYRRPGTRGIPFLQPHGGVSNSLSRPAPAPKRSANQASVAGRKSG